MSTTCLPRSSEVGSAVVAVRSCEEPSPDAERTRRRATVSESDPSAGCACFRSKRAGERRVKATAKARAISARTTLLVPPLRNLAQQ